MLTEQDLKLLQYVWQRGRTGWSKAACFDRAYPERRHISPSAKSQVMTRLAETDEWKREWKALDDAAREEVQQSVKDFTRTLADRSRDPYERFSGFEFAQVERSNETTGEILGFEVAPAVRDVTEIPEDLLAYIASLRWEPTCGMFIIVPRETVDAKTRAKYADMFAKATGSYAPEKLELTGKDGAPVATITSEMTSVEASELYKQAVRGKA
jgi:hypothetical protein